MPKKITKLTPTQEIELVEFRARWLQIGCSTEPADRPRAQAAISQMYREIGEHPPAFLWLDSPMAALLAIGLLQGATTGKAGATSLRSQLRSQLWSQLGAQLWSQLESQLESQLGAQLWAQLRSQLGAQLWAQLGAQLGAQLRSQLWSQLESQLGAQLGSQLWSQLESQLGAQLESQLRSQLRSQLWSQLGAQLWSQLESQLGEISKAARDTLYSNTLCGQHSAAWVAFYLFCRDVAGVTYPEKESKILDLWGDVAQSTNWWWPYKGLCVLSERPSLVAWNDRARLHSATGPAVEFRDGYRLFAFNGVSVPGRVILTPESYTPEEIRAEQNTEIVRAIAERLGWPRFLEKVGAVCIDKAVDDKTGLTYELLDVPQRFGEFQPRLLRKKSSVLKDGTQPFYCEPVHAGLTSAMAARKFQAMAAFLPEDAPEEEYAVLMQHCNQSPELSYQHEA